MCNSLRRSLATINSNPTSSCSYICQQLSSWDFFFFLLFVFFCVCSRSCSLEAEGQDVVNVALCLDSEHWGLRLYLLLFLSGWRPVKRSKWKPANFWALNAHGYRLVAPPGYVFIVDPPSVRCAPPFWEFQQPLHTQNCVFVGFSQFVYISVLVFVAPSAVAIVV